MSDKIEITKEEYFRLRYAEIQLIRLENGGVDNWNWYSDSLNPDDGPSLEEVEKDLRGEIFGETP